MNNDFKKIDLSLKILLFAILPRILLIVSSLLIFKLSFSQYLLVRDGPGYIGIASAFAEWDLTKINLFDARLLPGYSILISLLGKFLGFGLSGIVINLAFTFIACYLYFLIFKDKTTTWYFLFLPPAWLMNTSLVMAEGLAMALILGSLYLFLKDKYKSALSLAVFGIIVKPIILFLVIIYLFHLARDRHYKDFIYGVFLSIILGFLYLLYCYAAFGDVFSSYIIYRQEWDYGRVGMFAFPYSEMFLNIFYPEAMLYKVQLWKRVYIFFNILFFTAGLFFVARSFKLQRNRLMSIALSWCIIIFLFTGSLKGWSGFHCYDRYILVAMPFLFYSMRMLFPKRKIFLFSAFIISFLCALFGNMRSFLDFL